MTQPKSLAAHEFEILENIKNALESWGGQVSYSVNAVSQEITAFNKLIGITTPLETLGLTLQSLHMDRLRNGEGPTATLARTQARLRAFTSPDTRLSCQENLQAEQEKVEAMLSKMLPYKKPGLMHDDIQTKFLDILEQYLPTKNFSFGQYCFYLFDYYDFERLTQWRRGLTVALFGNSSLEVKIETPREGSDCPCYSLIFNFHHSRQGGSSHHLTLTIELYRGGKPSVRMNDTVYDVVENITYSGGSEYVDLDRMSEEMTQLLELAGFKTPEEREKSQVQIQPHTEAVALTDFDMASATALTIGQWSELRDWTIAHYPWAIEHKDVFSIRLHRYMYSNAPKLTLTFAEDNSLCWQLDITEYLGKGLTGTTSSYVLRGKLQDQTLDSEVVIVHLDTYDEYGKMICQGMNTTKESQYFLWKLLDKAYKELVEQTKAIDSGRQSASEVFDIGGSVSEKTKKALEAQVVLENSQEGDSI